MEAPAGTLWLEAQQAQPTGDACILYTIMNDEENEQALIVHFPNDEVLVANTADG